MKRGVCPNCGGVLVAESLGWKCKSCKGFISLQDGKFFEYVEKPFMPPQTNADRIRAMSDEELADLLTDYSNNGGWITETGRSICRAGIWDWLQQPVKDGEGE